jgi:bacteriocin-like protein
MDVAVIETVASEVQELTLAELAQVSGGSGDACFV